MTIKSIAKLKVSKFRWSLLFLPYSVAARVVMPFGVLVVLMAGYLGIAYGATVTVQPPADQPPFDSYARPFSWPMTGKVLQMYGFTDQAQNLGLRYPNLYPKGDPDVVFSRTNHTVPPPNPAKDKYINPNIDIAPLSHDASARAVYSTMAGWLTFADWAGEAKGYTIQIESDIEGDGQADLATRYMRLQPPTNGFFAPDVPVFNPSVNGPKANPQLLEAENMTFNNTGNRYGGVETDPTASGGKDVDMRQNSSLSKTVSYEAGMIIIMAHAEPKTPECGTPPTAPEMVVKIDGKVAQTFQVTSTSWAQYTLSASLTGGNHDFSIAFDNDGFIPGVCDRNLYVDVTKFIPQTALPNLTDSLIGKTVYIGYNQLIGYVDDSRGTDYPQTADPTKIPNANQTYLSYRIMYNNPNPTTFPRPDQPDEFINARVDDPNIIETDDNTVAGSLKNIFSPGVSPDTLMYFFCSPRKTGDTVKCVYYPNPI